MSYSFTAQQECSFLGRDERIRIPKMLASDLAFSAPLPAALSYVSSGCATILNESRMLKLNHERERVALFLIVPSFTHALTPYLDQPWWRVGRRNNQRSSGRSP